MASSLALKDALINIHEFGPRKQAKIKLWYPKLDAAQRKVRMALAGMIQVLNVPPISLASPEYDRWDEERKSYEVAYDESWKQLKAMIAEYENAPIPSCVCSNCLAVYNNGMSSTACTNPATTKPSVAAAAPRRSSRLAAKPRINYKM